MTLQDILLSDWNKEWLPQLMEALVYFAAVYFIGFILYHATKTVLPVSLAEYVYDFIKTMLICAYPIGLILVRTHFGDLGFMVILIPLILLTVFTIIPGETTPVTVWVKFFQNRLSFRLLLIKTISSMAAGFVAFYVGIFVLRLQLQSRLFGFTYSTTLPASCSSALKVPLYQGFVLEMLGVMYDSWFVVQKLSPNLILNTSVKVANTGMLVITGSHLTGMFMHPAKASGLTFGCGQTSYTDHLIVYWIGPLVGAWLSTQLQKRLRLSWINDGVGNAKSANISQKKLK